MNKLILIAGLFFFMPLMVFASNPSITSVDFNQFFAGKQGTFVVNVSPDTTIGVVEFYEGTTLISQQQYSTTNNLLSFNRTYSNNIDFNVSFKLTNITGGNTTTSDDRKDITFHVKKEADLEITSINVNPSNVKANENATVQIKITNVGDVNTNTSVSLITYFNSNQKLRLPHQKVLKQ